MVPGAFMFFAVAYLATVAGAGSPDSSPPDPHAEWLLDVEAPPTQTPAPTAIPTPVPTPAPTLPPPPPPEPVPQVEYVYAPPAIAPVAAPPVPTPPPGEHRPDWAQAVLAQIQQARANAGLGAVAYDGSLQASADYYVELHARHADVFNLNHWLDGGPGDRAWARGYCCAVAEIMATAMGSPEQIFDLWLGSPSHSVVIFDPAYDHVGVSCYQGPYDGGASYPVICAAEFGNSN